MKVTWVLVALGARTHTKRVHLSQRRPPPVLTCFIARVAYLKRVPATYPRAKHGLMIPGGVIKGESETQPIRNLSKESIH